MAEINDFEAISFTPGGTRLAYSNNPESVKSTNTKYTVQVNLVKDTPVIHDYYHHNVSGSAVKFGIVIKNTNSTAAKIRLTKYAIKSSLGNTQTTSANMHLEYNKSTNDQYITIPANSCKWIDMCTTTISTQYFVCCRAFITAASSGLISRIAYGSSSCSASAVFNASRAESDGLKRTSATFRYDTRYANIDMDAISQFIICARNSSYLINKNEFADSSASILAGADGMPAVGNDDKYCKYLVWGNFSVYYIFNFKNNSGKKITIKQNESMQKNKCLMQTDGKTWVSQEINQYNGLTLNISNISTFKFILTGGNFGNIAFYVS